jgi:hypothetical protein
MPPANGQTNHQNEVQPRLAVFREVGDRLSAESDEDAIYEEVEYYLEEDEPTLPPSIEKEDWTTMKKLVVNEDVEGTTTTSTTM